MGVTVGRRVALAALLLVAGCGGGPDVGLLTGSEPVASRRGLRDLAQAGPVPVVIEGPEAPAEGAVLDALGKGIYGVGTELTTMAAPRGPHLVARFGAANRGLCDSKEAETPAPGAVTLGYCDEGSLVAAAANETPAADEETRLETIAVAARAIFPDDYEPYDGYRVWPRVGVGISSGGRVSSGVGVGIGF
ncbi:MAG: hypothetical protein KDG89_13240 [Geminicoccaceae bacterium]|nr:hypothetical protein [Geminicoccaceae bacterium]